MGIRAVIVILCSVLVASCSLGTAAHDDPGTALWGTKWRVVELGASPPPERTTAPAFVLFDAAQKRMDGSSGLNQLSGRINIAGKSLRLERVRSTRRSGPPEAMHFESELLRALELTSYYRISGSELILRDRAGKPLARFVAEPPSAADSDS